MTRYVAGFYFTPDRQAVWFIKRNKPEWQAGKCNAIGGRMTEEDQTPEMAMVREFKEKTDVTIPVREWRHFCDLLGLGYVVHFFEAEGDLSCYKSGEQPIGCAVVDFLLGGRYASTAKIDILEDLRWLIPLAQRLDDRPIATVYAQDVITTCECGAEKIQKQGRWWCLNPECSDYPSYHREFTNYDQINTED